jgi:uncharacterized protein involved in outer membrane biogenesis
MPTTNSHSLTTPPRRSLAGHILRWVFALILTLVLLAGATLVAIFSLEQSTLQPLVEEVVTRITGREFSIEGNLDFIAGRIVTVRVDRIRLANANWGSSDDMLLFEGVEVSVDLLPLLGGTLAIDNMVISNGSLLSERDEQGRSNWAMGESDDLSSTNNADPGELPLLIARAELSDIDITVKNPGLTRSLDIHLESVVHNAKGGDELSVIVIAAVDDRPVNLQARVGPLKQLLGKGEVDFDINGDFDAFQISANGGLDNLFEPRQSTLHIVFGSADVMQISSMFALPESVSGAVELDVKMVPDGDHHNLDIEGSIGALNLDAHARLQALDSIDGSAIKLIAQGPDLASIAKLAGLNGLPSKPFRIESSVELSGKHFQINETRFDSGDNHLTIKGAMSQFPELVGTNLNLQLHGKNYLEFSELLGLAGKAGLKPAPFKVHGDLEYSARDQQNFSAQLTLGDISGEFDGKLTEYPEFVGSHLKYQLNGANSAEILRFLERPTLIDGAYALQGEVKRTQVGFVIERAMMSFGASELDISGMIGKDPLHHDTELSMHYRGPDLGKIAGIAGYTGFVPGGVAEITAGARVQPDGIHLGSLDAQLGRTTLKGSGLISLQEGANGSQVKVRLAGEDIADVLPPDLLSFVDPQQSFELTGTLATDAGQLVINALQAKLGEVSLEASGTVSMTQPLTDISLALDARGPDLAAIIPEHLVPYSLPAEKFSLSGGVALTEKGLTLGTVKALVGSDRLELSGTIPLDTPSDGLNLAITASGPNLGNVVPRELDQLQFTEQPYEIAGNIQLSHEILSVRQLDFSTPRVHLAGQLSVSLENPRQFGQFDLKGNGDNFAEFSPSVPEYNPVTVPFDLDARGNWDSQKVSIERGILQLDNTSIEVQGEVHFPPSVEATRLVLSARGANLADLGQFRGLILPPDEFRIDASLQVDANALDISELDARIGESDFHGSVQVEFAEKPKIRIVLVSDVIDLAKLLPPEDSSAEVEAPPQPQTSDGRLIPRLPVPADQLNRVNLEARVRLGELRLSHSTLKNIEIDTSLQDGNLTISQLTATAIEGQLNARFQAVADGDRIVTSGVLEGKDIVIGKEEGSEEGASFPKQHIQLEFETAGATVRELAANLNGYAQLTGKTGRMKNSRALDLFGSFFTELLSSVNPFVTREPFTTISCFAAYAEIIDGVAKINPGAVMKTNKLVMFARGQVDLSTEQVNLRFDTTARTGIGISVANFVNPFVGVSGTLASPKLGVDPENAMFEGGFAYATGGLSIVVTSLFKSWFGAKNSCEKLEKEAQEFLHVKRMARQQKSAAEDQ